jgi:serine/threonine protein kinase
MERQQWECVKRLFEAALSVSPEERLRFLEENCATDETLRSEVILLLKQHEQAGSFLEQPLFAQTRVTRSGGTVAAGTVPAVFPVNSILLNRFRIVGLLGRGGMGEVYEAEDRELHDQIAVKTIRSELAQDPNSIIRFKHEIQLARRITHPNVIRLFDLFTFPTESEEKRRGVAAFITMQLLSGVTLAEKVREIGFFEVNQAVSIAIQICRGLTAAHRTGIIHRDLKTANVMLVRPEFDDERAVIMDFGLALATVSEGLSGELTRTGTLMGTLPYMAPEQLEGGPVTRATDIYALGLVLYELVTGSQPFAGESPLVATFQRLKHAPKPPRLTRPDLDPHLEAAILKCLEYYPERRYQTAEDLETDLLLIQTRLNAHPPVAADQTKPRRLQRAPGSNTIKAIFTMIQNRQRWLIPGVIAVMIALIVFGLYASRFRGNRATPQKPEQVTSASTENPIVQSVLSPDGKMLAYGDRSGIHLLLLETREIRTLSRPQTLGRDDSWWPTDWFPDGNRLLAASTTSTPNGLKVAAWVVSAHSGNAIRIREDCLPYTVSPDGSRIAFTSGGTGLHEEIWTVGPQGDAATKVESSPTRNITFSSLHWSPDGKRLIYRKKTVDNGRSTLESTDLNGRLSLTLVADTSRWRDFCWLATDRLLFSATERDDAESDMNLWELRINPRTGAAIGNGRQLTDWAGFQIENLSSSKDGMRVAFEKISSQTDVFVAQLRESGFIGSPRRLTLDDNDDYPFFWSKDNKQVFFSSFRRGSCRILKQHLDEYEAEPILSSPVTIGPVRLTPDGSSLLYVDYPHDASRLMLVPVSGGVPQKFGDLTGIMNVACSQKITKPCIVGTGNTQHDRLFFFTVNPPDRQFHKLFDIESDIREGRSWTVSPDGSQIAINKNNPDGAEIDIYSLSGLMGQRIRVAGFNRFLSIDWSPDGRSWFVGAATPTGCALLQVNLDGSYKVLLNILGRGMRTYGIPSWDGKLVAFLGWTVGRNTWILDRLQKSK